MLLIFLTPFLLMTSLFPQLMFASNDRGKGLAFPDQQGSPVGGSRQNATAAGRGATRNSDLFEMVSAAMGQPSSAAAGRRLQPPSSSHISSAQHSRAPSYRHGNNTITTHAAAAGPSSAMMRVGGSTLQQPMTMMPSSSSALLVARTTHQPQMPPSTFLSGSSVELLSSRGIQNALNDFDAIDVDQDLIDDADSSHPRAASTYLDGARPSVDYNFLDEWNAGRAAASPEAPSAAHLGVSGPSEHVGSTQQLMSYHPNTSHTMQQGAYGLSSARGSFQQFHAAESSRRYDPVAQITMPSSSFRRDSSRTPQQIVHPTYYAPSTQFAADQATASPSTRYINVPPPSSAHRNTIGGAVTATVAAAQRPPSSSRIHQQLGHSSLPSTSAFQHPGSPSSQSKSS